MLSVELRVARENHICWDIKESGKVLLVGGKGSSSMATSEGVSPDDPYSRVDFDLVSGIS